MISVKHVAFLFSLLKNLCVVVLSYFENLSTSTVFVFSVHHFEMIFDVLGCEICYAFRLVPFGLLNSSELHVQI